MSRQGVRNFIVFTVAGALLMTIFQIIFRLTQNAPISIESIFPYTLIGLILGLILAGLRFLIKGDVWEKT